MISSRISFRRGPHRVPQSDSVVARNFSKLAGPFRYHRDSRLVPPECLISRRSYGEKGEDRTLQIPSRFPPCPTRVPSIWQFLRGSCGELDPSHTIVIPAMSQQSAWYLGDPGAVSARPGSFRYHRDSYPVPECLVSEWSEGGPGVSENLQILS